MKRKKNSDTAMHWRILYIKVMQIFAFKHTDGLIYGFPVKVYMKVVMHE